MSLFSDIGIILGIAALAGTISYFLKQPLVLAYILAGILIGPYGLGLVTDTEFIHVVGDIGIMLMLFLVGLEMNVEKIKSLGKVALTIGFAQILITGLAGFLIAISFGFTAISSLYIALALTFSSTAICIKLLSDQKSLNSLYGKMVVGILLVQDLVAILALVFVDSTQVQGQDSLWLGFFTLLLKGLILALVVFFVLRKPLALIFHHIARSHELLILVSLSWCFLIALVAQQIGFSREMGAFLAGLSLANLPYALEVSSKARILRDFFITTFFVTLGAGMVFASIASTAVPFVVLTLFVLVGSPIIVLVIMRLFGFDVRSAFFTGITIAQISEFSFILISLGFKLGHVSQEVVSLISMIAIVTISLSSYMMKYQQELYQWCKPLLQLLPALGTHHYAHTVKQKLFDHIILLGCGSGGHQLLDTLAQGNKTFVVVDHDPEVVDELNVRGIHCIFGDIQDEEVFAEVNVAEADMIISLLPHIEDNFSLLTFIKGLPVSKKPMYLAAANTGHEGFVLFNQGADYVVVKSSLEAEHIKQVHADIYASPNELTRKSEAETRLSLRRLEQTVLHDKEYAEIVHTLSKMRLQELQQKRN